MYIYIYTWIISIINIDGHQKTGMTISHGMGWDPTKITRSPSPLSNWMQSKVRDNSPQNNWDAHLSIVGPFKKIDGFSKTE
jgi:hypothetical protein